MLRPWRELPGESLPLALVRRRRELAHRCPACRSRRQGQKEIDPRPARHWRLRASLARPLQVLAPAREPARILLRDQFRPVTVRLAPAGQAERPAPRAEEVVVAVAAPRAALL